jgi:ribosomal protein S8E
MKEFIEILKKNLLVVVLAGCGILILFWYVLSYRPGLNSDGSDADKGITKEIINYDEAQKRIAENKLKENKQKKKARKAALIPVNEILLKQALVQNETFEPGRNILKDLVKAAHQRKLENNNFFDNRKLYTLSIIYKGFYEMKKSKTALIKIVNLKSKVKSDDIFEKNGLEKGSVIKISNNEKIGNTPLKLSSITHKKIAFEAQGSRFEVPINVVSALDFKK